MPLLYQLMSPETSPVQRALVAYANIVGPGGLVGLMLILWWRRHGSPAGYWHKWALQALVVVGHQAANVGLRFAEPAVNYPLALWRTPAAVHISGSSNTEAAWIADERVHLRC